MGKNGVCLDTLGVPLSTPAPCPNKFSGHPKCTGFGNIHIPNGASHAKSPNSVSDSMEPDYLKYIYQNLRLKDSKKSEQKS